MTEPLLTVRGEVVLEVEPEVARLWLGASARDPDRAKTLRLLNERAEAVDHILADLADGIEKVETSQVRIAPQLKPGRPKERITGYLASIHHTVTVKDFNRLGDLLTRLANEEHVEIGGPSWALRPGSEAYRQARVGAVEDALRRAHEYAEAIGSRLVALVELSDASLMSGQFQVQAAARRPPGAAGPLEELTFDINPAQQTVHATVEARFRMSQPDLGAGIR